MNQAHGTNLDLTALADGTDSGVATDDALSAFTEAVLSRDPEATEQTRKRLADRWLLRLLR